MSSNKIRLASIVLLVAIPAVALAAITQAFKADSTVVVDSIVSLNGQSSVTATNLDNSNSLLGVVTDLTTGTAQVATTGVAQVLVSDVNGKINTGTPITASVISGVGQKATSNTKIIGLAQASLSTQTAGSVQKTLVDKTGKSFSVTFGTIPVLVGVGDYVPNEPGSGLVPTAVQNAFNAVAGHSVPPVRIIISVLLLAIVLIVLGIIVNTSVHSSLVSIGRNPLASSSLLKGLLQILIIVIVVLAVTFAVVFYIISH